MPGPEGLSAEEMGLSEEDMRIEGAEIAQEDQSKPFNVMEKFRDVVQKLPGGKFLLPAAAMLGMLMSGERAQAGEINYAKEALKINGGIRMFAPQETVGAFHIGGARMTEAGLEASTDKIQYNPQEKLGDAYYQTEEFAGDYKGIDTLKAIQAEDTKFDAAISKACADKAVALEIDKVFNQVNKDMWLGKPGEKAYLVSDVDGEEKSVPITWAKNVDVQEKMIRDTLPILKHLAKMEGKTRAAVIQAIMRHELESVKIGVVDMMNDQEK